MVEAAIAVFAGRLDGIEIRTHFASGLPPVFVDREQFKRVVVNLVDNAAEAMQESLVKELLVCTRPGPAETVEAGDRGYRLRHYAGRKGKTLSALLFDKGPRHGAGAGHREPILADHHAHIRVEDNQPAGARFTIEIPVALEGELPKRREPAVARGMKLRKTAHSGGG